MTGSTSLCRFGPFELDRAAFQLRRDGQPVRLERQPMDLLIMLIDRRGALVTRAEIAGQLWGPDVFVEVEAGVHTAVRKVRQALGDSAETPQFVETVAGRGYRFIASVTDVENDSSAVPSVTPQAPARVWTSSRSVWLVGAVILLLGVWAAWQARPGSGPARPVRLAILPFANLTADPAHEYLADGLTEETIASVGQVDPEHVEVVGRTSMMTYKQNPSPLADIGSTLGADYLIESAIRVEGTRVRVTSRLIRARDQVQVWADAYDRETGDALTLQQDLSRTIAAQVASRVAPERLEALERRQTRSPEAYDLYLRSRDYARQRTPLTGRRAVEYLEKALAIDDRYALAWATLAQTLGATTLNSDVAPDAVRARAVAAARRAVESDASLSDAQFALGYVAWVLECDYRGAEAGFRRALALDPNHPFVHIVLGHALSQLARHDEARRYAARARELDPLNGLLFALSSQIAFQAGDSDEAVALARRAIALEPRLWIGHMMLGQALERGDEPAQALDALATAARLSDQNSKPLSLRAYVLARTGQQAEAREVLAALEAASRQRYVPPFTLALVHAGLGETAHALTWLERAAEVRDVHLMYLPVDPKWAALRSDPRFGAVLSRCGFATPSS